MLLKIGIYQELEVMKTLQINAEEWLFIQLLLLCKEGEKEPLFMYFNEIKKDSIPRATLESLIGKNILDNKYVLPEAGSKLDPASIPFSKEFFKKYFKSSLDCGEELLKAYPMFIGSGGRNFPVKNITKNFISLEAFSLSYAKSIKFNKALHEEILELVKWATENDVITCGIGEFVVSKKWQDLQTLRENGGVIGKFDTSELL